MIVQQEDETRLQYLSRVLNEFMDSYAGEHTVDYDGVECDGACLAADIEAAIDFIKEETK